MINRQQEYHTPVLVDEAVGYLITRRDGIYIDGTLGGGGHAEAILQRLSPEGKMIGIDKDEDALTFAQNRLKQYRDRTQFMQANYSEIGSVMQRLHIEQCHGILLDLGVSSHQLDSTERGFSFQASAVLDMRMDRTNQGVTAEEIINTWSSEDLASLFWKYGEERHSRAIARAIVRQRDLQRITMTDNLRAAVETVANRAFLKKTLARIFQALRIAVNDELSHLQQALQQMIEFLTIGGRIVVISYHSLEDRIVKDFFRSESRTLIKSPHRLLPDSARQARLVTLTKKPLFPSVEEQTRNPRARSAKLRVAEKIA